MIGRWVRRSRLHIAMSALVFYLAAVPVTVVVFPDNSLWLALLVIAASAVQSLLSVADLLDEQT